MSERTFEERWNSHISELTGLGWNLNEEDTERLFELRDELKELAETAAENEADQ